MVKVDKGDWDVSRGPELNHEFNTEWLRRCQRVLKPNGTIWVTGTHHVIFSIGYALQQLGFKILNDIAWEKPNPPPNLSCRYFTHSTETVLWAAKNEKSKHVFNYQEMRKVTGKQMKTVWRKERIWIYRRSTETTENFPKNVEKRNLRVHPCPSCSNAFPEKEISSGLNPIWTLVRAGTARKGTRQTSHTKTRGAGRTLPVGLDERRRPGAGPVSGRWNDGGRQPPAQTRLRRGRSRSGLHLNRTRSRVDREIIEIWLRHFRVRVEVSVFGGGDAALSASPAVDPGRFAVGAGRAARRPYQFTN